MSFEKVKATILGLAERALVLNGVTADHQALAATVHNRLKGYADSIGEAEALRRVVELYKEAANDPSKMRELCALRLEQTDNYILPTTNFMRLFFEVVNLNPDQRPMVQNTTKNEIRIGFVGSGGSPKAIRLTKPLEEALIDLRWMTTEKVDYPLVDIYAGDISKAAQATIDLAFDGANKMDQECFDLLTAPLNDGGAFGTFTFTGSKPSRVWVPNSRILTANLPTTNDITLSGNSASTKFRFQVLKEIGRYAAQYAGAFPDGNLEPTGVVVVPAKDIWDLADEVTPTGSTNNPVATQVLVNGPVEVGYLGPKTWVLVGDNTIQEGVCYAQYNKRVGTAYRKPALDQEFVDTQREKNIEYRHQVKVWGANIKNSERIRIARFRYRTA